ncbi:MAG: hypothetical protein KAS39_07850 [Actinomycetia bacterium]|nr:hypothetical protein [Actinomycetes bacterium]
MDDKKENNTRLKNLVKKFINSTVASENLTCKYALSSEELKPYLNLLFEGKAKYPICHYEFLPK